MDRRELLGVLGTTAAGLAVVTGGSALAQEGKAHAHGGDTKTLNECEDMCGRAARHCLDQLRKGVQGAEKHALAHELAMDCQATCSLATDLTARGSKVAHYVHAACAEVCAQCARACEQAGGDEIMKDCARICREAEKHCRQMAKAGGHAH